MANKRLEAVSYRPFRAQPVLSEGLLAVSRDGGELERKVASGFARLADEMGRRADLEAERAGTLAGRQAAMDGAPTGATVSGGEVSGGEVSSGHRVYTGSGIDQAKALLRDEEGFRETPYWDVNANRVGYGSDTVTDANGRSTKVTKGVKVSREDAERDLNYRLSAREGAQVRRQIGDQQFNSLAPNVQAALYSVGYNYGSLPSAVVNAVRGGDMSAVASAVAGLSANPGRRKREAALIRGGSAAPVASSGQDQSSAVTSASVAPVSVTPVSIEPGKPGTFRPTGRNTVYGRAYDVAGTRTYLETVDMAMVQNQQAIFDKYQDDPVMLEKALGENLIADLRDNVFPEIEPEYRLTYAKRSNALLSKARNQQREKAEAANRVEFLGRVDGLENRKSQLLAGLSMGDEAAAGALEDVQSSIDAHYESAVARGVISPAEAERAKSKSRSDLTVGYYTRQASSMNADEIRKMRHDMTRDYADGKLEGVTADDWSAIDKGLAGAESARRTQDTKSAADLTKRGEDLAKRVARGLPVSAEEFARFQLDAGTAPNGKEIVASTLIRLKVSDAIRTQPIGAVEKSVKAILGDGATADDIDFARKTIADHRKDLQSDPLGVAERFGVLPISEGLPLDGDIDADAVSGAFAERINASNAAGQHFGVTPKYFRAGEAEQIEAVVKADPAKGLAIAAGLVDAAGRDSGRVLRELGEVAPAVALSGSLVAAGGNRQAALDLITGFGKTPDGKNYTDMPNTKRIPVAQAVAGNALSFSPTEVNRLDEAASSIARKRLYEAGIDPKKDDAKPIYEKAYQEAAGATFANGQQYGGFTKYKSDRWFSSSRMVLLPPSIRADKFGDLIGALEDADVGAVVAKNGKTWTASDFKKAMPVAVNGGFVFALGDPDSNSPQFIADANGDPVVLDIAGLREQLGARVPGAYR
jgi:GH24 family phage-related lysozyme (muramidase)